MSTPHIVFVEDNSGEIELLRMALDQQGEPYELITLRDGAEALAYVRGCAIGVPEPEPCVILLDFHLPKYDGLEVLAAVKREPALRHIHIILLASGPIPPQEELKIQRMGAIFQQKPANFAEVLELAAHVLELCRSAVPVH